MYIFSSQKIWVDSVRGQAEIIGIKLHITCHMRHQHIGDALSEHGSCAKSLVWKPRITRFLCPSSMSNEENAADRGVTEDHEENLQEGEETRDTRLCHPPSTAYCQACSTRGAAPQRRWCKGRFHRRCPEYVSLYILDAGFRKKSRSPLYCTVTTMFQHLVFQNKSIME